MSGSSSQLINETMRTNIIYNMLMVRDLKAETNKKNNEVYSLHLHVQAHHQSQFSPLHPLVVGYTVS